MIDNLVNTFPKIIFIFFIMISLDWYATYLTEDAAKRKISAFTFLFFEIIVFFIIIFTQILIYPTLKNNIVSDFNKMLAKDYLIIVLQLIIMFITLYLPIIALKYHTGFKYQITELIITIITSGIIYFIWSGDYTNIKKIVSFMSLFISAISFNL